MHEVAQQPEITIDKRHRRQLSLIPPIFYATPATIIGCGAIGRQVALQLASAGVLDLTLIDADIVTETNLSNQGYREKDIDLYKVDVCCEDIREINSQCQVHTKPEMLVDATYSRMLANKINFSTVFICVDSITARKNIYDLIKKQTQILIDGRMTAESMRIISIYQDTIEQRNKTYEDTLFTQEEAQSGPCTARSTIYCANIAAGMMVSQYTKILRGFQPEPDFCVNLLGNIIEILKWR